MFMVEGKRFEASRAEVMEQLEQALFEEYVKIGFVYEFGFEPSLKQIDEVCNRARDRASEIGYSTHIECIGTVLSWMEKQEEEI